MSLPSPRLQGVREHLERAQWLCDLAQLEPDTKTQYRLLITAVYSCRAITELMLEAAERQEIKSFRKPTPKQSREDFEMQISSKLPFYALIEKIRIHDFHRFGLVPPDPCSNKVTYNGPMKLTARQGTARISIEHTGPHACTTGDSEVKGSRPLLIENGEFFDDDSKQYVSLCQLVRKYLEKVPAVISEFEGLLA